MSEQTTPHGPDWSDWRDDHPEEGPSCRCGFNGAPEECAAWRQQTTPRTVEELDALPDGTKVRDRDGDVWERWGGEWHTRETRPFDSAWLFRKWAPLTVLPDAPAPAAEDFDVQQNDDGITRADEDREALARSMLAEATGRDDAWGVMAEFARAPWLAAADAALAWFAARQPAPTVSAEGLATTWPVGTVLRGTETYPGGSNTKTIRITAVTEQHILAVDAATGRESTWTWLRDRAEQEEGR